MIKRILILLIILSTIIGCSTDEPIINPISPKTTSLNRIDTNKNINLENIRVNNRKSKRILDTENTIDVSEIDETIPDETEDIPEPIQESNPYEDMVLIPAGDFYRGHISYKKIEIESGWDEWGTYRTTVTEKVIPETWELIYTDAFYIDTMEVMRRDYRKFCEATGRTMPPPPTRDEWDRPIDKDYQDNYPITRITWQDAKDYAEWIGKRLPTSAEWEKAARGGLVKKPYVWGDICIIPNSWIAAGNFRLGGSTSSANAWSYLGVGLKIPKYPTGSKIRENEYGITDMSGNATEYVSDGYDDNGHFTMGASFATGYGYFGTAKGNRFYDGIIIGQRKYYKPEDIHINTGSIGFRCVKDIE